MINLLHVPGEEPRVLFIQPLYEKLYCDSLDTPGKMHVGSDNRTEFSTVQQSFPVNFHPTNDLYLSIIHIMDNESTRGIPFHRYRDPAHSGNKTGDRGQNILPFLTYLRQLIQYSVQSTLKLCKTLEEDAFRYLGFYAVYIGTQSPMFPDHMSVPSPIEDETERLFRNVGS